MKERNGQFYEIDIMRILKVLWQRVWVIVLSALVAGAMAFSYAKFMIAPTYQASTLMFVNVNSLSIGGTSYTLSLGEVGTASNLVDMYMVILKSRTTLQKVINRANLNMSCEQLAGMISAGSVNETAIFRVNVTGTDPDQLRVIANTIADVLPEGISNVVSGCDARVVDRAITPQGKLAPNITKYTAVGLLLGAVLAAAVLILIDMFDDAIRDTEYLTQNYEVSIMAIVPNLNKSSSNGYTKEYQYAYGKPKKSEKGKEA